MTVIEPAAPLARAPGAGPDGPRHKVDPKPTVTTILLHSRWMGRR
jgi:hypothetical protein